MATEKTWTLDGEFDTGILDSVNHDAPNNHQLQLNTSSSTEPYIWVANVDIGTVTKIDTRTGKQVAKYDSVLVQNWDGSNPVVRPPRGHCNSPSRTAVDGTGNAYVTNRAVCAGDTASATKYAGSLSACVDRNGNGVIDTSRDANNNGLIDINNAAEFKGQADECILWTKSFGVPADLGRSAAVDGDQNIWVGGYSSKLYKLNGTTGALMQTINPRTQVTGLPNIYGIAIGPGGFIYTSGMEGRILLKINPNAPAGQEVVARLSTPVETYGLAVDRNGIVWLGNWTTRLGNLVRADFAANRVDVVGGFQGGCGGYTRGVAVDSNGDVWTSCWSNNRLLRFNSAGTYLGSWPVSAGPVGAAVDGDGKIWTANLTSDTATRFDPLTNTSQSFPTSGQAYSYSDMTGFQQRNFTVRQGDWTVQHDAGQNGAIWGPVTWNREPQGRVPAGTSITAVARAADSLAALANAPFIPVTNGQPVSGLTGRYIEIIATLLLQTGEISPVLSDLSVVYTRQCIEVRLSDYNLFLEQDYTGGHDVVGKVAAGGNISMEDFAVGSGLPDTNISNTLVAGGNLTLTRGQIWGDARYGGTYTADPSVTSTRGTVEQGTPINFAARFTELRAQSTQLAALPVNGTTTREGWGGVMLVGTSANVNVFDVNASDLNGAKLWSINAPAGSFAVVNVRGNPPTFNGFGIHFSGGIDQHGVLFNFVDATAINAHGFGFWGTVLAPYAHITFNDGSWDGGIYAKSLTGYAEGHINPLNDRDICQ
ncbi:choice-of-anchor A family protein [Hyalangium sp.]|uniref:choice-of-anchor A family protein n=1 Tax=Hyalangium sp. TaxID=2028555 RepID=UPI002D767D82|nr:choice-of-anchor A family protein [Hyalangium sp.]